MFAPGQRIIHPEYGDITADVLEELVEMQRLREPVILEREQAEIAALAGTAAKDFACGRMVGQVHADVFDYWAQREGLGFWYDKKNVDRFMSDNPATRVISRSGRAMVTVDTKLPARHGAAGRGRWGTR